MRIDVLHLFVYSYISLELRSYSFKCPQVFFAVFFTGRSMINDVKVSLNSLW